MKEIFVSVVQTFNTNWNEKNISTPFVVIFLIGIYYIYRTNKRDLKAVFVYPVLIYIIIIFNPFIHWILIWKMGFSGRSHRFFWIIPMVFVLSWLATEIVFQTKGRGRRSLLFFALVGMCFLAGRPMYYEDHYRTENIYKVTNETIQISNKLKELEGTQEKRVVINEHHLNYLIRQYDPSICLLINVGNIETLEQTTELDYKYNLQKGGSEIIVGYFHNHYETELDKVYESLKEGAIEYLVLNYEEKALADMKYIELVALCGRFNIYKVS